MQDELEKILDASQEVKVQLPFRVQDLPTEDLGSARPQFAPAERFKVGGQQARLDKLIQYNVYSGVLCGIPDDPANYISAAIERVEWSFPWFKRKPFVIPPKIRVGSADERPWAIVPPVATIALFCNGDVVTIGLWFQDAYGLPSDSGVLDALSAVELKAHSIEWNP